MIIERADCLHMNGYKPCKHHKAAMVACDACMQYKPVSMRILIIKVGAAGEVIRNTPLLHRLRELYPDAEITWVTDYPELIPSEYVDRIMKYDWESAICLSAEKFDLVLSLDKEKGPCALANRISSKIKKGFCLSAIGKIMPFDGDSQRKWLTGIDDRKMLENRRHYVEEVFEICGYEWSGEKYILPKYVKSRIADTGRAVVGINTGSGRLWKTRIPNIEKIEEIIKSVMARNYEVLLLGGPDEHERNTALKGKNGLYYFGVRSLRDFINIVDNCDAVITPVTMTLHVAIGLGKPVILLNNIFNSAEFHLYGKGAVIQPRLACLGCYKKSFDAGCPVDDCTLLYDTDEIIRQMERHLPRTAV